MSNIKKTRNDNKKLQERVTVENKREQKKINNIVIKGANLKKVYILEVKYFRERRKSRNRNKNSIPDKVNKW